jgi:hypothetical protein
MIQTHRDGAAYADRLYHSASRCACVEHSLHKELTTGAGLCDPSDTLNHAPITFTILVVLPTAQVSKIGAISDATVIR